MILNDFEGINHHMMNMELTNWIYMLLGICAILIAFIIVVYLFFRYNIQDDSTRIVRRLNKGTERIKFSKNDNKDTKLINTNFCYNCGRKLIDNSVKYCPYCGIKI